MKKQSILFMKFIKLSCNKDIAPSNGKNIQLQSFKELEICL